VIYLLVWVSKILRKEREGKKKRTKEGGKRRGEEDGVV
jgi:hypothetical protein